MICGKAPVRVLFFLGVRFFRRSIRENPHRRMQIRLDVNFHGFCIRLRRSYLRDSPLSKDFEKRERSIFCKANILTVGATIGRLPRLRLPLGEAVLECVRMCAHLQPPR